MTMLSMALDHVWQSTLFAAAVLAATWFVRRQGARIRFWLWFAASAKFLIPFATLSALGSMLARNLATVPPALGDYMHEPIVQMTAASLAPMRQAGPSPAGLDWQSLVVAAWLVGTTFFAMRWILAWLHVRSILHDSEASSARAALPVRVTAAPIQPALTGVFRPCILLPRVVLSGLSPAALEAVLAHETWHWRHRDHWWSPVHRMVEVLFWFYPLTWWLGARLNEERERACDEAVLAEGFAAEDYAASLVRVCALHLRRPQLAAGEMAASNLKTRIDSIVAHVPVQRCGVRHRAAFALALLLVLVVPLTAGFSRGGTAAVDPDLIRSKEHPASEAVLRTALSALRTNTASAAISPKAVIGMEAIQFRMHRYLTQWGALKALNFSHTDAQGDDQYEAVFERGRAYFVVRLDANSRILAKFDFHVMIDRDPGARPHPGTEQAVRRYIAAMTAGKPNYADMTADFAGGAYRAIPVARYYLHRWGDLRSITFLGRDEGDLDVYRVRFARGWSDWRISALSDGKIWNMRFWGVSTGPSSTWQARK
jgi:beta-lactamase regulating signal transducer with metallopeptidase domain